MMQEKTLWPLFSKPIFKTYVDLESLDLSNVKWAQNYNNWISDNQRIIEQPEFEKIAEQVYHNVCEYFYGVMRASNDVEIYITESWLNKTEKGQVHHRHWHPNSILSGIVYLQGDPTSGRTSFITSQFDTLEYTIEESNLYNSRTWSVDPEVGSMLVFPSNVEHLVEEYLGEEPRITMSFNTFIRGDINKDPLLQLSI
jgi:uncharacterized protein (TIGR02466 family)